MILIRAVRRAALQALLSEPFGEVMMVLSNAYLALDILLSHSTAIVASPSYNSLSSIPPKVLFGPLAIVCLGQAFGLVLRNRELRCIGAMLCFALWLWMTGNSLMVGTTAGATAILGVALAARALALLYLPRGWPSAG